MHPGGQGCDDVTEASKRNRMAQWVFLLRTSGRKRSGS